MSFLTLTRPTLSLRNRYLDLPTIDFQNPYIDNMIKSLKERPQTVVCPATCVYIQQSDILTGSFGVRVGGFFILLPIKLNLL